MEAFWEAFWDRRIILVKIISPNELDVKVWERGAGATLACGTGACASLVATVSQNKRKIGDRTGE